MGINSVPIGCVCATGIKSDAAQQPSRVITKLIGHPGMGRFVGRDGEKQHHHVNQQLWD